MARGRSGGWGLVAGAVGGVEINVAGLQGEVLAPLLVLRDASMFNVADREIVQDFCYIETCLNVVLFIEPTLAGRLMAGLDVDTRREFFAAVGGCVVDPCAPPCRAMRFASSCALAPASASVPSRRRWQCTTMLAAWSAKCAV